MKITYLTHQYFPRHVGGTEVYTHGLATRARRAGHDARVITYVETPSLDHADYRTTSTEYEGIPVTELHYNLSRADHLGRRATQQQAPKAFGAWLSDRALEMREGSVPTTLVSWLYEILNLLEPTESDITSWLADVVDFRYPLDVYLGTISYFDAQVGVLSAYLKECNLYDQSLIIVTSPHGEILLDRALPYHHFLLTPDTLRVPLIIKPPASSGSKRGCRIKGVFDLIDIFPTVLDFLDLPIPDRISGTSRLREIKSGAEIPGHDSFAAGLHQLSQSVYRPPRLLTRVKAGARESFVTSVTGAREILFDLRSGKVYGSDLPDVAEQLRRPLTDRFDTSGSTQGAG